LHNSVHGIIQCSGCHRDIAKSKHPVRKTLPSARALSVDLNQACKRCHGRQQAAYDLSVHASLAAHGDGTAPVCSSCHGSHSVQPAKGQTDWSEEVCASCHDDVSRAYERSVHAKGGAGAPGCVGCHNAHDVSGAAASDLPATCEGCHTEVLADHGAWLPNAGLHLSAVACSACHSPSVGKIIDLQLYDTGENRPLVYHGDAAGYREILQAVDPGGDGLQRAELQGLFDRLGTSGGTKVSLRGRMEAANGAAAHHLESGVNATRACDSCHRGGSEAFRTVVTSIALEDGRALDYPVDSQALTSIHSLGALSDFYAPGGTRITLLDLLLIAAVAAGIGIPVVHFAAGRYLRRRRRRGPDHD
jgi:predicted CXXCH cytochrome family protein